MPDTNIATTEQQSTAVALPTSLGGDVLGNPALFAHTKSVASIFCKSTLVPEHLRKNIADVFLALAIARRMNEDPVMVTQNIYFVSGKAGWSASYMIARANRSGTFKGPIRWTTTGAGDDMVVTARGKLADTGEEVTAEVGYAMAKAEGWTRNSKYNTMREHMLRYRSATMLIRLYCPEVMMGMQTSDELEDLTAAGVLKDVTGAGSATVADSVNSILSGSPATPHTADGEILDAEETADQPEATSQPAVDTDRPWQLPDNIIGQDARMKAIRAQFNDQAETVAEIDAITAEHAEFIAKLGKSKATFEKEIADRRLTLGGGQ